MRARAGTVLLDNIDALIFAGLAFDGSRLDDTPSYAAAGWAEGGGAFEIRMRTPRRWRATAPSAAREVSVSATSARGPQSTVTSP